MWPFKNKDNNKKERRQVVNYKALCQAMRKEIIQATDDICKKYEELINKSLDNK